MNVLDAVDAASLRKDLPNFRPGDELKVHVRVVEGNKSRIQVFQGLVIARQGSGVSETFTVRKISYGVGVERIFPSTHLLLKRLNSSAREKFVARSFITSVIFVARLQRSASAVAQMILKLSTQLQKQLLLKRPLFKRQLLKTSLLKQ